MLGVQLTALVAGLMARAQAVRSVAAHSCERGVGTFAAILKSAIFQR